MFSAHTKNVLKRQRLNSKSGLLDYKCRKGKSRGKERAASDYTRGKNFYLMIFVRRIYTRFYCLVVDRLWNLSWST